MARGDCPKPNARINLKRSTLGFCKRLVGLRNTANRARGNAFVDSGGAVPFATHLGYGCLSFHPRHAQHVNMCTVHRDQGYTGDTADSNGTCRRANNEYVLLICSPSSNRASAAHA